MRISVVFVIYVKCWKHVKNKVFKLSVIFKFFFLLRNTKTKNIADEKLSTDLFKFQFYKTVFHTDSPKKNGQDWTILYLSKKQESHVEK